MTFRRLIRTLSMPFPYPFPKLHNNTFYMNTVSLINHIHNI